MTVNWIEGLEQMRSERKRRQQEEEAKEKRQKEILIKEKGPSLLALLEELRCKEHLQGIRDQFIKDGEVTEPRVTVADPPGYPKYHVPYHMVEDPRKAVRTPVVEASVRLEREYFWTDLDSLGYSKHRTLSISITAFEDTESVCWLSVYEDLYEGATVFKASQENAEELLKEGLLKILDQCGRDWYD